MLRIEAYTSESPMKDPSSIIGLIQKQMESVSTVKTCEQIETALAKVFKPGSRAVIFVGHDDSGRPVAFAFGNVGTGLESGGDYFWLNDLYVDASCRRLGFAGIMLVSVENWLKERGIRYLACVTGKANTSAQSLYEKNGFELNPVIWVDKSL